MDLEREPFELGEWRVDAPGNRLLRGSEVRPLRHKAMALLVLLARHAGQTVTRDEIVDAIWAGNHFVAGKAINNAVWTIRQALGDDPDVPRYVETIAKKGYRMIATVRPLARDLPAARVAPERPDGPVAAGPPTPPPAAPAPQRRWPARLGLVLLLLAVGLVASWAWLSPRGAIESAAPMAVVPGASTTSALPGLMDAVPLTALPGQEYVGQVSPDGRWLAFAWWQGRGDGQLHLRPAQDMQAPAVAVGAGSGDVQGLAWSPDSQDLVFAATPREGGCTVWRYTLASRHLQQLATCLGLRTPIVDWSPDGRWIVFTGQAEGAGGLFLVAPDGSGKRRLSTSAPAALADHQPAWSPDSRRVAFVRQDPADGTRDLHEVTLDGLLTRLSTMRLYALHGITYTADGQDLVFSTTRLDSRVLLRWDRRQQQAVPLGLEGSAPLRGADGRIVYALMRVHVGLARLKPGDGTLVREATAVGSDRQPDVHAGSGRTVFVSRRTGAPELWLAEPGGAEPQQLTRLDGVVAAPSWSPDGSQIAFLGNCGPGKRLGLCLLRVADGQVQPLAADAANYGRPAWHPSGQDVWASSDRSGSWQLWRFSPAGGGATPVPTELPPGRAVQWAGDGSGWVYQARGGSGLRWHPAGPGAERALAAARRGETLVDWRLSGGHLVTLNRGEQDHLRRLDLASGREENLGVHPLGTFPEQATLAVDRTGGLLIEVANTGLTDLMRTR